MARAKPKIVAAKPEILPARQEIVYGNWDTQDLNLTDNGSILTGYVRWRRCRYVTVQANGGTQDIREFAPDDIPNPTAMLPLDNFDTLIEADPDFGEGRDLFMAAAVRRAKKLGILT
jgi:hypothetical protein